MKKKAVTAATAALLSTGFSTTVLADTYYQVRSGDTLSQIAKKYNTSISSLKGLNSLSSDLIFVNQKLKVSGSIGGSPQSTVSPGAGAGAAPSAGTGVSNTGYSSNTAGTAAKTYRVVGGDTLLKIANKHGISLAELKQWNTIESHLIYPGQVINVSKPVSGGTAAPVPAGATGGTVKPAPVSPNSGLNTGKPSVSNNADGSKYVIKSGDTLGKISQQIGVSVAALKSLNNLSSDLIFAGQTLVVSDASGGGSEWSSGSGAVSGNTGTSGSGVSGVTQTTAKGTSGTGASMSGQVSVNSVIAEAKKLIGIPYLYGGQTTSGFDCSGFIYYVHKMAGSTMNRQSSEGYYNRTYYVDSPQVGDLVFFKNTYREGISHLGIYVGNNEFIHAGSSGVMISSLGNSYWNDHFDSFKRFY
ncbi:C40 family peptidase [Bacillus benzoevorans]|uniref:Peptidoglycan endopeptidase LytE n=1 Tax=Bacillus benzoevorans TaxID=1456 RepID=A0A7X0HVH1_9BACI|nr:peptidoglycan endopeptidase [Bacillus benzoevorans]MBB6447609.1 peptidoglycan endopeptidase LytE [Bacillus benzoevorans]